MTKYTYLPEIENALAGLGRLLAASDDLKADLGSALGRVAGLGSGRPWGTSDAGDVFGQHYLAGQGGSEAVIRQVNALPRTVDDSASTAASCLVNSRELDEAGRRLFSIDPTVSAELRAGIDQRRKDGLDPFATA